VTINKQEYLNILTEIEQSLTQIDTLESAAISADSAYGFEEVFIQIENNLSLIQAWAQQKVDEANQEEAESGVMNNFMVETKAVFDKYAAQIEIAQFESGYGVSYGEPGVGFVLTASFDGVSSTKEIKKSVIVSEDLV
jgi:hypothetical protein